jgi:hypothetical protein
VRLEPLSRQHTDDLSAAGAQAEIWRWWPTEHHLPGSMPSFIDAVLLQYAKRKPIPFATIDVGSSRAVGSTRCHFIEPEQRRLESG